MCDENIYVRNLKKETCIIDKLIKTKQTGSVMDTTRRVREKGYEVIIFNPNGNYWYKNRAWVRQSQYFPHAV